jgi:hypothetical protein
MRKVVRAASVKIVCPSRVGFHSELYLIQNEKPLCSCEHSGKMWEQTRSD